MNQEPDFKDLRKEINTFIQQLHLCRGIEARTLDNLEVDYSSNSCEERDSIKQNWKDFYNVAQKLFNTAHRLSFLYEDKLAKRAEDCIERINWDTITLFLVNENTGKKHPVDSKAKEFYRDNEQEISELKRVAEELKEISSYSHFSNKLREAADFLSDTSDNVFNFDDIHNNLRAAVKLQLLIPSKKLKDEFVGILKDLLNELKNSKNRVNESENPFKDQYVLNNDKDVKTLKEFSSKFQKLANESEALHFEEQKVNTENNSLPENRSGTVASAKENQELINNKSPNCEKKITREEDILLCSEDSWITLSDAERITGIHRGTIGRYADRMDNIIRDNKHKGSKRKVSRLSVMLFLWSQKTEEDREKEIIEARKRIERRNKRL